jgi:uncharacterized membrane protein
MKTASLLFAVITTGLMAGLFTAFAYAIMPALGKSSDHTFVEAMQKINTSILNGWFMLCFLGAVIAGIVAAVVHFRTSAWPWIVAGVALYVVVLAITGIGNVPLNNQLEKAGNVADAAARQHFETTWVRLNLARAIVNVVAFGCLSWALVLHGRAQNTAAAPPAAPSTYSVRQ